jgi:hypothetical protein
MLPWCATVFQGNHAGSDLSKSIATRKPSAPSRDLMATILWAEISLSTKPGPHGKAAGEAEEGAGVAALAGAVVADEGAAGEDVAAGAEAGIVTEAIAAGAETAAGNSASIYQ